MWHSRTCRHPKVRRAVPMTGVSADLSPVRFSGIPNSPVHARTGVRDSREGRSAAVAVPGFRRNSRSFLSGARAPSVWKGDRTVFGKAFGRPYGTWGMARSFPQR